jgi:hypothetical protein
MEHVHVWIPSPKDLQIVANTVDTVMLIKSLPQSGDAGIQGLGAPQEYIHDRVRLA